MIGLEPRRVRTGVADRWIVGAALAAVAGAYLVIETPAHVALLVVGVVALRSPRLAFIIGCALLAGWLSARSLSGLDPPERSDVEGRAALVSDPEWVGGAIRFDLRFEGRRYEAWARGRPAFTIEDLLTGEAFILVGEVEPFDDEWLPRRARHVVGQIDVESVGDIERAAGLAGIANSLRRSLVSGASSLSRRDQVLLAGFSVGDDRRQLPEVTDDFRAAGLTHLTAVSGQNVAFVLLLIGPLLSRVSPRTRLVVTGFILLQFGLITRWEPSVMRAVAMAMAASAGQLSEGKTSGIRALGLVVLALIVIDPMLVHSVGFALSVMASVGIALWSERLRGRIGGPRWLGEPLALTLSAQLAVAPILIATFGSMPLISVPANVAAGPVSGPLMAWGLVVGPIAGALPDAAASVLHVPTRVLAGYVANVAATASGVGAPDLGPGAVLFLLGCFVVTIGLSARAALAARVLAVWLVWVAAPGLDFDVRGAQLVKSQGQVLVVIDQPSPERLLSSVRRSRVGSIDVVVMGSSSSRAREALTSLLARHDVGLIVGAKAVEGWTHLTEPVELDIGVFRFELSPRRGRIDVGQASAARPP